jgi:murein L,D-transpeptidase YcbB/YkuD
VISQIRKKLFLSDDIVSDSQNPVFDSVLYFGIRSFQARFGLNEDGVAGPSVLHELAAPLSRRIQQIVVNMERCRWLPTETDSNYLVVNIPSSNSYL